MNYKYDNKKYAITVYLDKEAMDLNNAGKEFVADVSIAGPNVSQNGVYQVKFTKEMLSKLTEIGKSSENKDEKPADRLKALNEYIANLFENVVEPTNKEDKEDKKDTTDNKDEAKKMMLHKNQTNNPKQLLKLCLSQNNLQERSMSNSK